jgi:hypothetical protein
VGRLKVCESERLWTLNAESKVGMTGAAAILRNPGVKNDTGYF